MKDISFCCYLYGENFSPNSLEKLTGLSFIDKNEVGEIYKYGPDKGEPILYGSATLKYSFTDVEKEKKGKSEVTSMLETLEKNYQVFKIAGVEEIDLYLILAYEDQCNWEFTKEQIQRLAALGLGIAISCYQIDDEDESEGS